MKLGGGLESGSFAGQNGRVAAEKSPELHVESGVTESHLTNPDMGVNKEKHYSICIFEINLCLIC